MIEKDILYIDDQIEETKKIYDLFLENGIEIATVNSPFKALELLSERNYHIVITDHEMPEMKGDEFISEAQSRKIKSNFMVLSYYEDQQWRQTRSFQAGSLNYFFKSNLDSILKAVNILILLKKLGLLFPSTYRLNNLVESDDMIALLSCLSSHRNLKDFRFLLAVHLHLSFLFFQYSELANEFLIEIGCASELMDLLKEITIDDRNNLEAIAWELINQDNNLIPKIWLKDIIKTNSGQKIISIILESLSDIEDEEGGLKKYGLLACYRSDFINRFKNKSLGELREDSSLDFFQPWIIELVLKIALGIKIPLRDKANYLNRFNILANKPEKDKIRLWKYILELIKRNPFSSQISELTIFENLLFYWEDYYQLLWFSNKMKNSDFLMVDWLKTYQNLLTPFKLKLESLKIQAQKINSFEKSIENGDILVSQFESKFIDKVKDPQTGYNSLYSDYKKNKHLTVASLLDKYLIPNIDSKSIDEFYIIIFDGMPYYILNYLHNNYFSGIFSKHNQIFEAIYSILPSSTRYSRKAIFAGKFPIDFGFEPDPVNQSKLKAEHVLLAEKLYPRFTLKSIKNNFIIHKIDNSAKFDNDVISLIDQKARIKVIIFDMIDEILHKASSNINDIGKILFEIYIKKFFLRISNKPNSYIIITSDHGYAKVSKKIPYPRVKKHSLRYLYDSGDNLMKDQKSNEYFTIIDGSIWGISEHSYRFALGNAIFIPPNKKKQKPTYAHGGISLSEMMIPVAVYSSYFSS